MTHPRTEPRYSDLARDLLAANQITDDLPRHIRAALDAVAHGVAGYNEAMVLGEHIAELEHALVIAAKQLGEQAADYREALGCQPMQEEQIDIAQAVRKGMITIVILPDGKIVAL